MYRTEFVGAGTNGYGADEEMYEIGKGEEIFNVLYHPADILMEPDALGDSLTCVHRLIRRPMFIVGNLFQILL